MRNRAFQIVVAVVALIIAAWLVLAVAHNWADWVVLGMIVVTFLGAAIALYPRRYKAGKRTFVRTTKPPQ